MIDVLLVVFQNSCKTQNSCLLVTEVSEVVQRTYSVQRTGYSISAVVCPAGGPANDLEVAPGWAMTDPKFF